MFPAMLWGAVIMRNLYTWRDTLTAVAITGGCFVFFTAGPTASRLAGRDSHSQGPAAQGTAPAAGRGCETAAHAALERLVYLLRAAAPLGVPGTSPHLACPPAPSPLAG